MNALTTLDPRREFPVPILSQDPRLACMRQDSASTPSDADVAAIIKVIRDETVAFQNRDYDAWVRCWEQDERTRDVLVSTTTGISVVSGSADINSQMRNVFENGLSGKLIDFGQDDPQIWVIGDCAWAVFDTWTIWEDGDRGNSFDTRILERGNDGWKIVYSSFVFRQNNGPEGLVLGLDGKGYVTQSSQTGLDAIAKHPFLTISHGRLRGRQGDWDKALLAALAQAGQHHGFFETYRFAANHGGPANYPVVLGKTDDGGVAVINLSIRDNVTYLLLHTDQLLDRRMSVAQTVYSLSDAQLKVARQIAIGESVKGAAGALGVSVNTARTHLTRLYEKTGVSTQAALVRLLLSVG